MDPNGALLSSHFPAEYFVLSGVLTNASLALNADKMCPSHFLMYGKR